MNLRENINIDYVTFIDIETAPEHAPGPKFPGIEILSKRIKVQEGESVWDRAAIFPEFAKVVCISIGYVITASDGLLHCKVKSFIGDELDILQQFMDIVTGPRSAYICAHNGKGFDFPFIAKRMLMNGMDLPPILDVSGKKPWEINWLDTMELWRFGDFKNYTSLEFMCHAFNIPSPKDAIDGSLVPSYFYEGKIAEIAEYCAKDVVALIKVFCRMRNQFPPNDEHIQIV